MATFIVCVVLFGLIGFSGYKTYKSHKNGGGCDCSCPGCKKH
ncbi:FeoB-associated Cys-rich membrane protein [Clostridium sp. JN-1]|nr:FeoB-associated Cys-rich membrane protein [Clostridium sp. JN-1]